LWRGGNKEVGGGKIQLMLMSKMLYNSPPTSIFNFKIFPSLKRRGDRRGSEEGKRREGGCIMSGRGTPLA